MPVVVKSVYEKQNLTIYISKDIAKLMSNLSMVVKSKYFFMRLRVLLIA